MVEFCTEFIWCSVFPVRRILITASISLDVMGQFKSLFNLDLGLVKHICTDQSFILDFPVWWNINVFLLKMLDFMVYGCFAHIYICVPHVTWYPWRLE